MWALPFIIHQYEQLISAFGSSHLGRWVTFCMLLGSWKSENGPLPITEYHPRLHPTHSGRPPPPNPSSDTSSWQPAPFNSLQHSLGLGNHWCSAPSVATTPAPSLVGPSHLGPYDGVFPTGCLLTSQKRSKVLLKVSGKSSWQRFVSFCSSQPPKCLDMQEMLFTLTTLTVM